MKRWKQRAASQGMPKICRRLGERQEDAPLFDPRKSQPLWYLVLSPPVSRTGKHILLIFKLPSLGSHHGGLDKEYKVLGKGIMDTAV